MHQKGMTLYVLLSQYCFRLYTKQSGVRPAEIGGSYTKNEIIQLEIHNQYKAVLIDEFQDTNELQESIIKQFAEKGVVFRVGDIKQSIYGFRQANPSIMKVYDPLKSAGRTPYETDRLCT